MTLPTIKVGICSGNTISFNLSEKYFINNLENILYGKYSAQFYNNKISILDSRKKRIINTRHVKLIPVESNKNKFEIENVTIGINFHWEKQEKQEFKGNLNFICENGEITAINTLDVEEYLNSVISSEMSALSNIEYLKTHAIISRSWVLSRINKQEQATYQFIENKKKRIKWYGREEHKNFDVCADDHCQRYQGISRAYTNTVKNAVYETKGIVLMSEDKICDARFSKCCGGISEDFENVWEDIHIPYLTGITDNKEKHRKNLSIEANAIEWIKSSPKTFCNTQKQELLSHILNDYDKPTYDFYRWKINYTQKELSNIIEEKSKIHFGRIKELIPIKRGVSGRIYELKIIGEHKTFTFGKELEIRKMLSKSHLYSSAFVVDYIDMKEEYPNIFEITGAGWGHGVGLCQIGAAVMIDEGYTYEQVLKHYFQTSELKKIY